MYSTRKLLQSGYNYKLQYMKKGYSMSSNRLILITTDIMIPYQWQKSFPKEKANSYRGMSGRKFMTD